MLTAYWKQLLILYFSKLRQGEGEISPNREQIEAKQELTVLKLMADALTGSLNVSLDANVLLCF